jgi:hypothetical protein
VPSLATPYGALAPVMKLWLTSLATPLATLARPIVPLFMFAQ